MKEELEYSFLYSYLNACLRSVETKNNFDVVFCSNINDFDIIASVNNKDINKYTYVCTVNDKILDKESIVYYKNNIEDFYERSSKLLYDCNISLKG